MEQYKFNYKTIEDVQTRLAELGAALPYGKDTGVLATPLASGNFKLANRLGVASMEGMDGLPDGSPGELTCSRYEKYARGGSGLIWYEAVSIVPEGRSSLKQMLLNENTLPAFQRMNERVKEAGLKANGYAPVLVMQANHSGRYSRPNPNVDPEPIIAYNHPVLERNKPVDPARIATDDYLAGLEESFGKAAALCKKAGFDAIDIKSCHGYLLAELASAYTRAGRYGGPFENRFRLFLNAVKNAQQVQDGTFTVTARVNIYDNFARPYGFGMAADGSLAPDYDEPIRLMKILHEELRMPFVNLTMGNPHVQPFVTRPCLQDKYTPPEDPLQGVARMFSGTGAVKKSVPGLLVSASAPSYLRQFSPGLAAGAIRDGLCDHVCFGRMSFANPNYANDIFRTGGLEKNKVCVTCSKCSELLRGGQYVGCVVRFPETYLQYHREVPRDKVGGHAR